MVSVILLSCICLLYLFVVFSLFTASQLPCATGLRVSDVIDRWENEVYYDQSRDFMKHSFSGAVRKYIRNPDVDQAFEGAFSSYRGE